MIDHVDVSYVGNINILRLVQYSKTRLKRSLLLRNDAYNEAFWNPLQTFYIFLYTFYAYNDLAYSEITLITKLF